MAKHIPIWPGSSSFSTGMTPFGLYDDDSQFQDHAEKTAETILSFESVYKGVRRRSFVFAMLNCLQIKEFDPERLKRKIKLQPNKL